MKTMQNRFIGSMRILLRIRNEVLCVCLFAVFVTVQASATIDKPLIWNIDTLHSSTIAGFSRNDILRQANECLRSPMLPVTIKKQSFSGNLHNYESLSTYFWPNPQNPKASYVSRDGEKNPERLDYDGDKINVLARRAKILSLAYYMTGNAQYAWQWQEDLNLWFVRKFTKMAPNMNYAQIIRNRNNNQGMYYGIIDAYVFIDVIESIYLMRHCHAIKQSTDRKIQKWFKKFTLWLEMSNHGKQMDSAPNNLSLAYDVMLCAFKLYYDENLPLNSICDMFTRRRLERQVLPDGSQPEELKRATPITYCIYNLEHVIDFSLMLKSMGVDYYKQHAARIDAAYNFIQQNLTLRNRLNTSEQNNLKYLTNKYNQLDRIRKERL